MTQKWDYAKLSHFPAVFCVLTVFYELKQNSLITLIQCLADTYFEAKLKEYGEGY